MNFTKPKGDQRGKWVQIIFLLPYVVSLLLKVGTLVAGQKALILT